MLQWTFLCMSSNEHMHHFLLGIYLWVEFVYQRICICSFSFTRYCQIFKMVPVYTSTNKVLEFHFPTFSISLGIVNLLVVVVLSILMCVEWYVLDLICIFLMINEVEDLLIYLFGIWISSCEMSISVICPFVYFLAFFHMICQFCFKCYTGIYLYW